MSHFRLVAKNLPKPLFLKDTFLVLTSDCIFPELETQELAADFSSETMKRTFARHLSRDLLPDELPKFFIWAYNVNWQPQSPRESREIEIAQGNHETSHEMVGIDKVRDDGDDSDITKEYVVVDENDSEDLNCNCDGIFARTTSTAESVLADEDGYEGRIKVDIHVLFSWFYYARLQGTDMKHMWHKAKNMPNQTWSCRADMFDPTKPDALV